MSKSETCAFKKINKIVPNLCFVPWLTNLKNTYQNQEIYTPFALESTFILRMVSKTMTAICNRQNKKLSYHSNIKRKTLCQQHCKEITEKDHSIRWKLRRSLRASCSWSLQTLSSHAGLPTPIFNNKCCLPIALQVLLNKTC